jgi:hypothetical protein
MRRTLVLFLLLILPCPALGSQFREGDIVFHTSASSQSIAIQLSTGSPYSHMGIVFQRRGEMFVLEAVQPVRYTPLEDWIRRGKGSHVVVKRLKDAGSVLTPATLRRMKATGEGFLGKDYDLTFGWSDERLYCSELVWKVYQRGAGIELGRLRRLRDFDLSHPLVREKLKERYGERIPLAERVISPADMYHAEGLVPVSVE